MSASVRENSDGEGKAIYRGDVTCNYVAGGRTYTGHRIAFADVVRCDPLHPDLSVLEVRIV